MTTASRTTPLAMRLFGVDENESDAVSVMETAIGWLAPGSLVDISPVHLLTSATLRWLEQWHPDGEWHPRRFRPNVLIDMYDGRPGLVENNWAGKTIGVGEVRLKVAFPMARCTMTTLAQGGLPRDRRILQTLARHSRTEFAGTGTFPVCGAAATIDVPGTVCVGDPVTVDR